MPKSKKNKKSKSVCFIAVLVVLLALCQLLLSHYLATLGFQLRQFEEKSLGLQRESQVLQEEITRIGGLSKISTAAQDLGLVRTTQVLHLTPQLPVAWK